MPPRKSKNQLRREKAKAAKLAAKESVGVQETISETTATKGTTTETTTTTATETTTPFSIEFDENDEKFAEFQRIFDKFDPANVQNETEEKPAADSMMYSDDEDEYEEEGYLDEQHQALVKSRKREKIPLAELKASTSKPDLVDWHDADAMEPFLLVHLKSAPNVVPVPSHWTQKREYLSLKRGFAKQPFELPQFIKDTGIMDMRETGAEDESTLKQRARERVQPKMGKMDIDYQKLHDAFFKFQTKPRLYEYGDQYFEGKEFEPDLSKYRPGVISKELREALNIPPGAPPPWLLQMQRFGPPPSYKDLRIPGVNAPIPSSAQWGFHPGGYGKPPLDENNQPLYGDVFGQQVAKRSTEVDKSLWGQVVEDEESSEEEEDEEDEEMEEEDDDEGQGYVDGDVAEAKERYQEEQQQQRYRGPTEQARDEAPLDLRKRRHEEVEEDAGEKTLYRVLPTKKKAITELMDTDFVYDMSGEGDKQKSSKKGKEGNDELQSNIDNLFDSVRGR
ncbi:Pre-mRNA-splicing factor sap145 [Yarrowia sp. C11]|nr:Pre-mRNA-splicing factor sap145 [Yarrowia sp. E02]KAG5369506.1 Pre-mRNA-splicing factor sap145 [Yarrowia sp. C11]